MAKKMKDQGHDLLFYEGQFGGHNGSGGLENTATQEALKVMYLYQKLMND
jgi:prolyl oligopeptidase PreP (S9A serine peptidase family)